MRITTKSDYAMILMVELAKQKKNQVLPLSAVTNRYRLSLSYLEQLASKLKKNNLIASKQGVSGGYLLAKSAQEISPREIIEAVGDKISPVECADHRLHAKHRCQISDVCNVKKSWSILGKMISKSFESISLKDLIK